MSRYTRRLHLIETGLTPRQIVFLWLGRAQKTGMFEREFRSPSPRSVIASAVSSNLREAMKGQLESLIEQAIRQGRQEADQLFILLLGTNSEVVDSYIPRKREFLFLLGHFVSAAAVKLQSQSAVLLRRNVEMFVEEVGSLRTAVAQIVNGHFDGHEVLFDFPKQVLQEQIQLSFKACAQFNCLACFSGVPELDYANLRRRW